MSGMGLLTKKQGNDLLVTLTVTGIDLAVPSNRQYLKQQLELDKVTNETQYVLSAKMAVRNCLLGEGLRTSGACYECPKGTYLLEAPTVPEDCRTCN